MKTDRLTLIISIISLVGIGILVFYSQNISNNVDLAITEEEEHKEISLVILSHVSGVEDTSASTRSTDAELATFSTTYTDALPVPTSGVKAINISNILIDEMVAERKQLRDAGISTGGFRAYYAVDGSSPPADSFVILVPLDLSYDSIGIRSRIPDYRRISVPFQKFGPCPMLCD